MNIRSAVMVILCIMLIPMKTYAGDPTDTVTTHVDRVMNVLKGNASEESKKADIRKIAGIMFDFTVMSKATLGKNWTKLESDQRQEFIQLLRAMLENAYISKILDYSDEKAVYIKERALSDTRVEVQSKLVTKSADIPMDYRMVKTEEQWKVYDVIIEGVSLIKNYRTQFREILSTQTPEELLQVMRKKVGKI